MNLRSPISRSPNKAASDKHMHAIRTLSTRINIAFTGASCTSIAINQRRVNWKSSVPVCHIQFDNAYNECIWKTSSRLVTEPSQVLFKLENVTWNGCYFWLLGQYFASISQPWITVADKPVIFCKNAYHIMVYSCDSIDDSNKCSFYSSLHRDSKTILVVPGKVATAILSQFNTDCGWGIGHLPHITLM